jgi:hypothetical protein
MTNTHTHPPEVAFDTGCPVCQARATTGYAFVSRQRDEMQIERDRLREALEWIYTEPEDALKVQLWARAALDGKPIEREP